MSIEQNLYYEKYRPKTLAEVIMPARIRAYVENGIPCNLIFAGSSGMGKTSLARLLSEHYPTLSLATNLGVDVLRDKVRNFCQSVGQISFDEEEDVDAPFRIVYFEEFDRATKQLQEELKSFMDEYADRVRFLATTNSSKGMDKNLLSRFRILDFTALSPVEARDMKLAYYRRVKEAMVLEGREVPMEVIRDIITSKFPDFRQVWQDMQYYVATGIATIDLGTGDERLFELVFDASATTTDVWEYLEEQWGAKLNAGFQELGRNFFAYVRKNHPGNDTAVRLAINAYSEFVDVRLPHAGDPLVTMCALVHTYQILFKK